RLRWDARTRAYMERRTQDGLSKKEIIRCLKRYVSRELYRIITSNDQEHAA
ncbi:IS110 family transposase, partial [Nonomuraea angiospora]|nr:IS110 family transposase [Nonomuraea angiospora]